MRINSNSIPVDIDNIDTDQIIPAQFLKQTEKTGLGTSLFFHWRYKDNGEPREDFILNQEERQGASIIIAGNNFGCGSSREHAAWSLADYGIQAVISTQFAEIFKKNAYNNGILPVTLEVEELNSLMEFSKNHPEARLSIDLETQTVSVEALSLEASFEIPAFVKECMLQGVNEIEYLIALKDEIQQYELSR